MSAPRIAPSILALVLAFPVLAHEPYGSWKDKNGFGCCDDRDCAPVRARQDVHGAWSILVNGRWMVVPRDAVLAIPSPDGRSHACVAPNALEPRCFVPGDIRS